MKANRKFLNQRDDAVSPVIAVILMVAITVVLAATVYVWVSGFGAQSSQPAKSLALSSAGGISENYKNYTVASASPGMKYSDIQIFLAGELVPHEDATCEPTADAWAACAGSTPRVMTSVVTAGDTLILRASSLSGATLRIVDPNSNSVMLTLTVA